MHNTSRSHGLPLIVGVFLALIIGAVAPASAIAAPEIPDDFGWVRFGHFAPEEGTVDVFVDGERAAVGVEFKTVTDYLAIPSGSHTFAIRPTGQTTSDPILSVEAAVPGGTALTIGAVSTRDGVATQVYTDALVQPAAGASLARFIHASPKARAVDVVVVDGPVLAEAVPFPEATDYLEMTPGTYAIEVRDAGSDDVILQISDWTIEAGVQSSVVIVEGADGRIDVAAIRDAVAVGVAPAGGIQTGGGSMADALDPPSSGATTLPLTALAAIAVLLAAAGVSRHRHHAAQ